MVVLADSFSLFILVLAAITWQQLGIHTKPIGLLNVNGFYDPLVALVNNGIQEGFIGEKLGKSILVVDDDPASLLDKLLAHRPPVPEVRWLSETQI